jgi:hypothetical protein
MRGRASQDGSLEVQTMQLSKDRGVGRLTSNGHQG